MEMLMEKDIKMTSLDIAELTGKQHADVMKDIRKEIKALGGRNSPRDISPRLI